MVVWGVERAQARSRSVSWGRGRKEGKKEGRDLVYFYRVEDTPVTRKDDISSLRRGRSTYRKHAAVRDQKKKGSSSNISVGLPARFIRTLYRMSHVERAGHLLMGHLSTYCVTRLLESIVSVPVLTVTMLPKTSVRVLFFSRACSCSFYI